MTPTTTAVRTIEPPLGTQHSTIEIRNTEAIKALFDNRQRSLLSPFFQPASISQAAEALDALPSTMLQFVRRMVQHGVLVPVDKVRRSGKQVQRYQTVAEELFIPLELCEDLLLLPEKRFHGLYCEALKEEVLSYHYKIQPVGAVVRSLPNGVVQLDGALGPEPWVPGTIGPMVTFEWTMLRLHEQEARRFQAELAQLILRFRTLPYGDHPYYFGMHFAPVPAHHPLRSFVNEPL
jgi:predicted transcriptional regulator